MVLILLLLLIVSLIFFEDFFDRSVRRRIPHFPGSKPAAAPRLALIIDDGGYNLDSLREMTRLGKPMTFAILPNAPHSRESALLVQERGGEVMLHLPMEPKEEERFALEKNMVKTQMPSPLIQKILREGLKQIPQARGVNNHMGSRATEDRKVMDALMDVLKEKDLYFIDSHTSANSLGRETARSTGVRFAQNDKFVDAMKKPEAVREALQQVTAKAGKEGKAVAIGHLSSFTVQAVQEMISVIEKAGIRLAFASEVVG